MAQVTEYSPFVYSCCPNTLKNQSFLDDPVILVEDIK